MDIAVRKKERLSTIYETSREFYTSGLEDVVRGAHDSDHDDSQGLDGLEAGSNVLSGSPDPDRSTTGPTNGDGKCFRQNKYKRSS